MLSIVTVFMTSNYDAVLAAEIIDDAQRPHVLVRAATGDEAAWLVSSDDEDGDCPDSVGVDITWQPAQTSEAVTAPAVKLWPGEVC